MSPHTWQGPSFPQQGPDNRSGAGQPPPALSSPSAQSRTVTVAAGEPPGGMCAQPQGALSQPAGEGSISNAPSSCALGPTEADPEMEFGYELCTRRQPQRQGGGRIGQREVRLCPKPQASHGDSACVKLPVQRFYLGPQWPATWVCT